MSLYCHVLRDRWGVVQSVHMFVCRYFNTPVQLLMRIQDFGRGGDRTWEVKSRRQLCLDLTFFLKSGFSSGIRTLFDHQATLLALMGVGVQQRPRLSRTPLCPVRPKTRELISTRSRMPVNEHDNANKYIRFTSVKAERHPHHVMGRGPGRGGGPARLQ